MSENSNLDKTKYMLDCNIFDEIVYDSEMMDYIKNHAEDFYITSIQSVEISDMQESEKKRAIQDFIKQTNIRVVSHSICFSNIDFAHFSFSGNELEEQIRFMSKQRLRDSLIGGAATKKGLTVVTNDNGFIKRMKAIGYPAINYESLRNDCLS